MKGIAAALFFVLWAAVLVCSLASCGSSGSGSGGGSSPEPIGLTGNWAMTGADTAGNSMELGMLLEQNSTTVNGSNGTIALLPKSFNCLNAWPTWVSGTVQTPSSLTGSITLQTLNVSPSTVFGTFTFTVELAGDGLSFVGTFSSMPSCTGLAASGTFSGKQVPSVAGNWSGTLRPCYFNMGNCIGDGSEFSVTMTLTQDSLTGNVAGTFATTGGGSAFSAGKLSMFLPGVLQATGELSGQSLWIYMFDNNGTAYSAWGTPGDSVGSGGTGLDFNGGFNGLVCQGTAGCISPNAFQLAITH